MITHGMNSDQNNIKLVYGKYKNTMSELIANIEVYEHDLPGEITAQIAEIFQVIASYDTEKKYENKLSVWKNVDETQSKVIQYLYKHAIFLFIQRIEEYKRIFRRYNYKGVMYGDKTFHEIATAKEICTVKILTEQLQMCYVGRFMANLKELKIKYFICYLDGYIRIHVFPSFWGLKKEPLVPIDDLSESISLDIAYNNAKELLKMYQDICPEVISNGTRESRGMVIFKAMATWIIPILVSIPVVLKIVTYIKTFI